VHKIKKLKNGGQDPTKGCISVDRQIDSCPDDGRMDGEIDR
jgi:hypothetical protein